MDVGPIRGSRPTERRSATTLSSQAQRQPDEPQPVKEEAKSTYRGASPRQPEAKKSVMRFVWPIITIVLLIALAVMVWFVWMKPGMSAAAVDTSRYQAVFF